MVALRRLPVIQPQRPQTRADCEGGPRPCPYVGCRASLLVDVLADGQIILNAPSKRVSGAERLIPDRHESARAREWFVLVRLTRRGMFALGPIADAAGAQAVSDAWSAEHGPRTARVSRSLPPGLAIAGEVEGLVDAQFADEADDAIEHWFDPDRQTPVPSCLFDEIDNIRHLLASQNDEVLLDEIGRRIGISGERVRQVAIVAMRDYKAALELSGVDRELAFAELSNNYGTGGIDV